MSTWEVEHDRTNVVCPDCAFSFDAIHQDGDGGYTCPLCEPAPASGEPSGAEAVVREAWRPIETAPKDGTYVLITGTAGTHIAHWTSFGVRGSQHMRPSIEAWLNFDGRGVGEPTHWMPLPSEEGAGDAE